MYWYLKKKKVYFECVYEVKLCFSYIGDGIVFDLIFDFFFLLEVCGRYGVMEKGVCYMVIVKCNICRVFIFFFLEGIL